MFVLMTNAFLCSWSNRF